MLHPKAGTHVPEQVRYAKCSTRIPPKDGEHQVAKGVNPEDGGITRRTANTMMIPGNQPISSTQNLPQDIEQGTEVTDSAEQGGGTNLTKAGF
jgi:hypothetical protein